MHILEITFKEIVYIGYQSWGDVYMCFGCEISMNASNSDEIIMHFDNWLKKMHILSTFNASLFYYN